MQVSSENFDAARTKAVQYLVSQLSAVSDDPYALSIITYALTLTNSSSADAALQQLNKLATNKGLKFEQNSFTGRFADT